MISITYTITIERIDVPQVGTRWTSFHEGMVSGEGELRIHKVYSDFEASFLPYVALTPDQLRAARNSSPEKEVRPSFSLHVSIDDPHGFKGAETPPVGDYETLTDCLFWSYTGGFDATAITERTWPFSFEGITRAGNVYRDGNQFLPGFSSLV